MRGISRRVHVDISDFGPRAIAIEASENALLVVQPSHKGDCLSASNVDSRTGPAGPQDGLRQWVGEPANAGIVIRDGTGRLLFELEPTSQGLCP